MRTWIAAAFFSLFLAAFSLPLAAQNNPMPYVSNPLVPAAAAPGGPGFTLTVNGAGFVSGASVKWNDSARETTVVSPTQVTAAILASDVATAGTIFVTVANPIPGGGISNAVFFQVTTPTTSLAYTLADNNFPTLSLSTIDEPAALTAFDLTNTGNPYLAVANRSCPAELQCTVEKASISIASNGNDFAYQTFTGTSPYSIASGDFNGDGLLDLITVGSFDFSILLNSSNTDVDFLQHSDYPLPTDCSFPFVLGDFNRDGRLDLVLSGSSGICFLPGNGDGTFGSPANIDVGAGAAVLATGDFNGDGKLDLVVSNFLANTISILLGNGDGTFQTPVDYSTGLSPAENAVTADFNSDGKVDIAFTTNGTTLSVLLGNGDGTFQPESDYPAGVSIKSLTMGDYNGDGIVDLAVIDSQCTNAGCPAAGSVNVLLGNGDGTFQSQLDFADGGQPSSIATGEFTSSNPVGRPGFAVANEENNTVSLFEAIPAGPVNSIPTISSISPSSALANSGAFTLTVNGTNFVSSSTVYFGGQARATAFVNAAQLTAAIQAGDLAGIGAVSVFVANPAPGGGDSTSIAFNVNAPPPTISSLDPSSVVAGGPAFTLMVSGLNFVNGAAIDFNGTPRSTTFLSATQLSITISASDIENQGTINISVTDPAGNGSGGGTSSSLPLTILPANTQPTVGALFPASTTAGGPAFTLTLTGTGFTASSVVTFNSNTVSFAYVSATQLQAAIPASAISVEGTPLVTVANPGGIPSVVVTFTVNNPVPGASSLAPSSLPEGNGATTLNIIGMNFNSSSKILIGGSLRATTYVSSTSLNAALTANDFTHNGTLNVTVNNPAPGGGTTPALTVTVEDFNLNAQTSANSVPAGEPANFTFLLAPANTTTANAVQFTATGLPTGATASFTPSAIPAGSGSTTVVLEIATTPHSPIASGSSPYRLGPLTLPAYLIGLAIIFMNSALAVLKKRSRSCASQFLLVSLLVIAAGVIACGGNGSTPAQQPNPSTGTAAGTYPIVVTATSGTGSLSATVMLTVI